MEITTIRLIAELRPFLTVPTSDLNDMIFVAKLTLDSPDFPKELKPMSEVMHHDLINEIIRRN
jgi:hypothetical protein